MLTRSCWARFVAVVPALVAGLAAQDQGITLAKVREVVEWLAADARAGRDTPSAGLDEAADWLAARFARAGLAQAVPDAWFHRYTLPGDELDSKTLTVSLSWREGETTKQLPLAADEQVRLWRNGEGESAEQEPCVLGLLGDPGLGRMLNSQAARKLVLLEVAADALPWQMAAGKRQALGSRRAAKKPVLLLKQGLLPAAARAPEANLTATWACPAARKVEVPLRNVVGLLPGTDRKDEFVLVSAHYDHIGVQAMAQGDPICNGADDDATGTTAVVLLAEALGKSEVPLSRSVLFVCFSAEEKGLRGSQAFAQNPPVPLQHIVANLNIEMIGRPMPGNAGKAWITGKGYSDFAAVVGPALQSAGVDLVDFKMADQLFGASDNYSFASRGVVAHSISAGSLHNDYHQVTDEVSKLDLPHMTKIIVALREAVLAVANRDARLQWSDAGKRLLESRAK